jgi:hypothetical protein
MHQAQLKVMNTTTLQDLLEMESEEGQPDYCI